MNVLKIEFEWEQEASGSYSAYVNIHGNKIFLFNLKNKNDFFEKFNNMSVETCFKDCY